MRNLVNFKVMESGHYLVIFGKIYYIKFHSYHFRGELNFHSAAGFLMRLTHKPHSVFKNDTTLFNMQTICACYDLKLSSWNIIPHINIAK